MDQLVALELSGGGLNRGSREEERVLGNWKRGIPVLRPVQGLSSKPKRFKPLNVILMFCQN